MGENFKCPKQYAFEHFASLEFQVKSPEVEECLIRQAVLDHQEELQYQNCLKKGLPLVKGSCSNPVEMDSKTSSQGQDFQDPAAITQSTADLTAFVQNLLQQMQSRFQTMSDSIITKIDEMGTRIDDLERSIGDLIKEVGVEPEDNTQLEEGQLDSLRNNLPSVLDD